MSGELRLESLQEDGPGKHSAHSADGSLADPVLEDRSFHFLVLALFGFPLKRVLRGVASQELLGGGYVGVLKVVLHLYITSV